MISGDSDFTPVLLRLRAYDRRTTILTVGVTAPAYRAACDVLLTEETFIEQALQGVATDAPTRTRDLDLPASRPASPPAVRPARPAAPKEATEHGADEVRDRRRRESADLIVAAVAESSGPIPAAAMAHKLRERFGCWLADSSWDGTGGFREFVESLQDARHSVSWAIPGYFYDPARHQLLGGVRVAQAAVELGLPELNQLAVRIHEITDAPLLTSPQYEAVFVAIADDVNRNGYFLTQTSRNVPDVCRERGVPVPRPEIAFILKGLVYSGALRGIDGADPTSERSATQNDPADLAAAFAQNVVRLCERAQLTLKEQEVGQVRQWIAGDLRKPGATESAPGPAPDLEMSAGEDSRGT